MALKDCKECGQQISTKATNCPRCGAKTQKHYSIFTPLLLIILGTSIYHTLKPSPPKQTRNAATPQPEKVTTPPAKWRTSQSKDEMTGRVTAYANSPATQATQAMQRPYNNVTAWLGVGCNGLQEWAYIGFSTTPNLLNTQTENGYNTLNTRIKWDEAITNTALHQTWGDKFLSFSDHAAAIKKIKTSSAALIELNWYSQQSVLFQFNLTGSATAIQEALTTCRNQAN